MINKKMMIGGVVVMAALVVGLVVIRYGSVGPEKKVLRFGHDMPIESPQHMGAEKFKQLVKEYSKGRLEIQIYPDQQLGTDPEMIAMVQKGQLAFSLPPTSKLTPFASNLALLDLPYLFEGRADLAKAMDAGFGKYLLEGLDEQGVSALAMWDSGFKHFTGNRALLKPLDFEGLRFRVMMSQTLVSEAINLNAFPFHVDFNKVKKALEDAEIDCQENPLSSIYAKRIYEAQTHLTLSSHGYLGQLMVASSQVMAGLLPEERRAIRKAARIAGDFEVQKVSQLESGLIEKIAAHGVKISRLTPAQKARFVASFAPLYYSVRKQLKPFSAAINSKIVPYLDERIAVGMDLSFSYLAYDSAISLKRGADLAIDELNRNGGTLGKKWILLTKNHNGFPRSGLDNLNALSEDQSVKAVLGGMHSPVVLSLRGRIKEIKIPYLIPWAAASAIIQKENPYLFRLSIRDSYAGALLVKQAKSRGKNIGLLLENTGWGKGNLKSIMQASASDSSLNLLDPTWFDWGKKDFSEEINAFKANNTDVVILVGNSPEGLQVLKTMRRLKINLPIVSHWGITGGRFRHALKEGLEKLDLVFLKTFSFKPEQKRKNSLDFYQNYYSRYEIEKTDSVPAPFGTIHSYDIIKMLAAAIQNGKSDKRDDIVTNLQQLPRYQGVKRDFIKPFGSNKWGQEALRPEDLSFGKYDESGKIIDVK